MTLKVEVSAVVVGVHSFFAGGNEVAKVTVLGNPDGPMGMGIQWSPAAVFELDAGMDIYRVLKGRLEAPKALQFRADLKPINASGGYAVHLLEVVGGLPD
tara:strand:- start:14593 stop:14892 length:300 start_codon:yes stop_codon:yes gene_type:complete